MKKGEGSANCDLAEVKKWMKRNRDIIGSVSIVIAPEQCRIQMNRTFLCVQDAELNGKIAKYKYQMKKTKVFGGNKLN